MARPGKGKNDRTCIYGALADRTWEKVIWLLLGLLFLAQTLWARTGRVDRPSIPRHHLRLEVNVMTSQAMNLDTVTRLQQQLQSVRRRRAEVQQATRLARIRTALLRCQLAPEEGLQGLQDVQQQYRREICDLCSQETAIMARLRRTDPVPR